MTKVTAEDGFQRLSQVMAALRDPENGCPWDLKQDFNSLIRYSLEEVYELIDAIRQQNFEHIKEELGDLLFHIYFYAHLAEEQGAFTLQQLAKDAADKLIARHPHVFAEIQFADEAEFKAFWEQQKRNERNATKKQTSFFDNIPQAMPALMQAYKIQKRVATVGFDWPQIEPVIDKINEELAEIKAELEEGQQSRIEEEIGDLLFAVVNLSRHLNVDPDIALHKANDKFIKRFLSVEAQLFSEDLSLEQATLEQMEAAWQTVKKLEHPL